MIGYKIKKYRELRNFSQEYMAEKLGISQNAYSKIESSQSKLSTDRLKQIAETLEVPEVELLSEQMVFNISNNELHNSGVGYNNFYSSSKELYEGTILELKEELKAMRKEREKLMELLEKKL